MPGPGNTVRSKIHKALPHRTHSPVGKKIGVKQFRTQLLNNHWGKYDEGKK